MVDRCFNRAQPWKWAIMLLLANKIILGYKSCKVKNCTDSSANAADLAALFLIKLKILSPQWLDDQSRWPGAHETAESRALGANKGASESPADEHVT